MSNEYNEFLRVVNKAIPSLLSYVDNEERTIPHENQPYANGLCLGSIGISKLFSILGNTMATAYHNYSKEIIRKTL